MKSFERIIRYAVLAVVLAAVGCATVEREPAKVAQAQQVAPAKIAIPASAAKSVTPLSNFPALANLKQFYEIPNFRLAGKYNLDADPATWRDGGEGGVTLESLGAGPLRTAYIAVGTPKRNAQGEITNAVVINTYYSGDSTGMYFFWYDGQGGNAFAGGPVVGPGRIIDTNKYYVVFLDAIGLWGASKPSDGLGRKFPMYSVFDMVQANYRLLRDHLKVAQVELTLGPSMGGSQSWVWGVMYSPSGFIKAIMPIGGTTASDGDDPIQEWTFRLAQAGLESDPQWRATGGNYYHLPAEQHPKRGLQFMWSSLQLTGLAFATRSAQPWANVQKEVFYWEPKGDQTAAFIGRTKNEDAVDFWYRNETAFSYNINADLKRIKARTLVVHVDNDNWLMVATARKAAEATPGAQLATFSDPGAHYGVFRALNKLNNLIGAFLDNRFTADLTGLAGVLQPGGAAPAKPAGLAK